MINDAAGLAVEVSDNVFILYVKNAFGQNMLPVFYQFGVRTIKPSDFAQVISPFNRLGKVGEEIRKSSIYRVALAMDNDGVRQCQMN